MNTRRSRRGVPGALSRRRPQIVAVALSTLLVASGVAVVKPRDYRAETRLRISASSSIDAAQLARRVEQITQNVVAPETMQAVALELGADGVDAESLRAATDTAAAPSEAGAWDVTIGHTAPDPAASAKVVELLAADYQWTAVQGPIQAQEDLVAQHEALATAARDELAARQDAHDRYVQENENYLEGPEERLGAVRDQLREVERIEIASYEGEIERLEQLLEEEPEFIVEESEKRDEKRISELRKEIRAVERELTVLTVEQKRTDVHPAVVAKRKMLLDLRDELTRVEADVTTSEVKQPNEMHSSLVKAKVEAEADLARARRKLGVLRTKESELLEEVRRAPDLRSERDRLATAVAMARQELEEHETALADAESALAALHAERPLIFETIEAPLAPRRPSGPSALLIAGAGLLLGGFLGVGVAYVADARDNSFRDATRVSAALGLPTLGAIDVIRTPNEERRLAEKRQRKLNTLLVIGVTACALLGLAVMGGVEPLQDLVRSLLP